MEPGAAEAHSATDAADALVTSRIAYAEVRAALARGQAIRRIGASDVEHARRELDARWVDMAKVDLDEDVAHRAGDLAARHVLRALDAVHLASAVAFLERSADDLRFMSWDRKQRASAKRERLALLPETL